MPKPNSKGGKSQGQTGIPSIPQELDGGKMEKITIHLPASVMLKLGRIEGDLKKSNPDWDRIPVAAMIRYLVKRGVAVHMEKHKKEAGKCRA